MELYLRVRLACAEGMSQREAAKHFAMSRDTVRKMLSYSEPPGYPPFDEWTETFGSERLTGALLDRLTHHVSILELNGESYRLAQSQARKARPNP